MPDWYPKNMDARAAWHQAFSDALTDLSTKYNIAPAQLTQVQNDFNWIQFWVTQRHKLELLRQNVTKYFNEIGGNDPSVNPPAEVNESIGDTPPPTVPPGVEFRTREIVRHIKGHFSYSVADGEALGIVADETAPLNFGDMTAEFTVKTLADFELEASFRKNGADAMRFEFRRNGGAWQPAAYLVSSPGTLVVPPLVEGKGEQIELRGILIKKNENVGNFSAIVPAFIAP